VKGYGGRAASALRNLVPVSRWIRLRLLNFTVSHRETTLTTLRTAAMVLVAAWSSHSVAQGHLELLSSMTGTWDVQQRMWPGPKKDPIALPAAIAQRRLIRDSSLEEVMQPVDDRPGQPGSFSRHALLNYNAVTSRYEYASLDTRASQLMVEQTLPIACGVSATELKLQGGSFLAPEWGSAKNVRFKYRLTIGAIKVNQQTVRLFLTPQTVLPKTEFLAFEYVYTKRP
jgi:hypothetical protein